SALICISLRRRSVFQGGLGSGLRRGGLWRPSWRRLGLLDQGHAARRAGAGRIVFLLVFAAVAGRANIFLRGLVAVLCVRRLLGRLVGERWQPASGERRQEADPACKLATVKHCATPETISREHARKCLLSFDGATNTCRHATEPAELATGALLRR